jgi:N-acetylglucosamine-6-phosphate deacetylase
MNSLLLKNCLLYNSENRGKLNDVLIENGIIKKISPANNSLHADQTIDADGLILVPGFIDVHIQGAGGADVLDGTRDALRAMSAALAMSGTTGFLATTVVKPVNRNHHLKVIAENTGKDLGGAEILGIHLEGPFINPLKKGGLDPNSIYSYSLEALNEILDAADNKLSMMTIAPELSGNLGLIRRLKELGIIASFGHSDATYEETLSGFKAGINHVTHIFNAMPSLNHRMPGPLLAIFENETPSAQIISDGVHLHPGIVNLIYKNISTERCICITDGIQAIGMPEGRYFYNGKEYESKDGSARYLDGTLIGTAVGLNKIAARFKSFTGCSLKEAVDTVTKNPAILLGIYNCKGSVEIGKDADLVLMNDKFDVKTTLVKGKIVFENSN